MNKYKLGNEICKLRESMGYTQSDLASILNVTDKAVSKLENGQSIPRMETFEALAKTLNTTIEYLIAVSKDNSLVVFVENNYATALHLNIDGKLVSIGDEGKWIEVNPNGFTMNIKGDFDFSFIGDVAEEETKIKNKLVLKAGQKALESLENLTLITECTYNFSDVEDGEKIDIQVDSVNFDSGLAVLRNFAITYPKIILENGKAELIKAKALNKKQYVKSFRRETVWSDLGLGFIWMIIEAPFVHFYINHLCNDKVIKQKIIDADKYKKSRKKSKHPVLKTIAIILFILIGAFSYAIFEPIINIKGEYPALISSDYSSIELHNKTYIKIRELPKEAKPEKLLVADEWEGARLDGESRIEQVTDDYKVQYFKDSNGNEYLWLVKDYADVILTEDGDKNYDDFQNHDIYVCAKD